MIRVLVLTENSDNGSNWYRAGGAFSHLHQNYEVKTTILPTAGWTDVRKHDVLFMSRPCTEAAMGIAQAAVDFSVPIWVDYDDNLFEIPEHNPARGAYGHKELYCIQQFLDAADIVSVTTRSLQLELQNRINGNKGKVRLVPNALDEALIRLHPVTEPQKLVLWRGTRTHDEDVSAYAQDIVEVMNEHQDFTFALLGADPVPWQCSQRIKSVTRVRMPPGGMGPMQFFKVMSSLKPAVLVCPLADNVFNRSKSSIAAIEGSMAGAAILAPEWEQWQIPGVVNYGECGSFKDGLDKLLTTFPGWPKQQADHTWRHVSTEMSLTKANEIRKQILKEIA